MISCTTYNKSINCCQPTPSLTSQTSNTSVATSKPSYPYGSNSTTILFLSITCRTFPTDSRPLLPAKADPLPLVKLSIPPQVVCCVDAAEVSLYSLPLWFVVFHLFALIDTLVASSSPIPLNLRIEIVNEMNRLNISLILLTYSSPSSHDLMRSISERYSNVSQSL